MFAGFAFGVVLADISHPGRGTPKYTIRLRAGSRTAARNRERARNIPGPCFRLYTTKIRPGPYKRRVSVASSQVNQDSGQDPNMTARVGAFVGDHAVQRLDTPVAARIFPRYAALAVASVAPILRDGLRRFPRRFRRSVLRGSWLRPSGATGAADSDSPASLRVTRVDRRKRL